MHERDGKMSQGSPALTDDNILFLLKRIAQKHTLGRYRSISALQMIASTFSTLPQEAL